MEKQSLPDPVEMWQSCTYTQQKGTYFTEGSSTDIYKLACLQSVPSPESKDDTYKNEEKI